MSVMGLRRFCIFFCVTAIALGAYAKTCDICKKEIRGRYYNYKKSGMHRSVCASCDRRSQHCDACNLPLRREEVVRSHGETLCRHCAKSVLHCSICKQRISGRYVEDKDRGAVYCKACFDRAPKCAHCDRPFHRSQLNENGLCVECQRDLPRCSSCNKPIVGNRYSYEFEHGQYCQDCIHNRPACCACGVPVGNTYWTFPDARTMCNACQKRGILKKKDAQAVLNTARRLLKRHLGFEIQHEIHLVLEEMNHDGQIAASVAKYGESNESPLAESELGLFRRKGDEFSIYLLYGMPEEMMLETAVHELTHAWQAENCPDVQPDEIREGFAQWAAAKILRARGHKKLLAKLEARPDKPYGTGYRIIKRMEQRYGVQGVIDHVKRIGR